MTLYIVKYHVLVSKLRKMTEAEAKDKILEFLVEHSERSFNAEGILESKILNDTPLGTIELFIERIGDTYDKVARVNINSNGHFISSNNLTPVFLKQGGFTKYEEEQRIEKEKIREKEAIELRKSMIDLELSEKMLQEYPKTKWFARIAFIIGLVLAILKILEFIF